MKPSPWTMEFRVRYVSSSAWRRRVEIIISCGVDGMARDNTLTLWRKPRSRWVVHGHIHTARVCIRNCVLSRERNFHAETTHTAGARAWGRKMSRAVSLKVRSDCGEGGREHTRRPCGFFVREPFRWRFSGRRVQ